MNQPQAIREAGTNGPEKQFDEVERKSAQPRDVERAGRNAAQKSDAIDFVRGEDSILQHAQENDPTIPDTKHKDKRNNEKNRHKPYRTIDRSRSK